MQQMNIEKFPKNNNKQTEKKEKEEAEEKCSQKFNIKTFFAPKKKTLNKNLKWFKNFITGIQTKNSKSVPKIIKICDRKKF